MNWMLAPTLVLACILTLVGLRLGSSRPRWWTWPIAAAASAPAIAYAGYYLHVVDEPTLLYSLRSMRFSELLAAGIGLAVGLVLGWCWARRATVWRIAGLATLLGALGILLLPYIKPVLRPADWSSFSDKRQGVAVMQTTPYSCGPATAATLLSALGTRVTELQLAREAFTSSSGTENWYLARAIRAHGHVARFEKSPTVVVSSIAGVSGGGYGHYIAVVSRDDSSYLVVDPLIGERRLSAADLKRFYVFTGFYLVVE